uniref:Uncharacterized protein n=1 Tax=Noctiluca scintillans TaxID=2966 RepID=A0A7S1AH83_NOCSC
MSNPPSWKESFKAHRIAANGDVVRGQFMYHREMDSFPLPLERERGAKRQLSSKLAQQVSKAQGDRMNAARLAQSRATLGMGIALPVLGFAILGAFAWSATSNAPTGPNSV